MHPQKQQKNLAPRKSQRQIKAPNRYGFNIVSYALQVVKEIDSFESTTYQEAICCSEAEEWTMDMNEEMESIQNNQTWDLVELPEDKQVVGCKWIFKKKSRLFAEEVIHCKTCLVAKAYSQKEGVDYNEVFFPIV